MQERIVVPKGLKTILNPLLGDGRWVNLSIAWLIHPFLQNALQLVNHVHWAWPGVLSFWGMYLGLNLWMGSPRVFYTERLVNLKVFLALRRFRSTRSFQNVFLQSQGHSLEFDGLLVCSRGVLIIETKSGAGDFYGGIADPTFRHTIGSRTFEMKNPIFQSKPKKYQLQKILRQRCPHFSVPIFIHAHFTTADSVQACSDYTEGGTHVVTKGWGAPFRAIYGHFPEVLDENQIRKVTDVLLDVLSKGRQARTRHMALIAQKAQHQI